MSLEDFKNKDSNDYEMYGSHEYDEKLENALQQFEDKFPIELNIKFIEVSPRMSKHRAKAYKRSGNDYYIRVSKDFIEKSDHDRIMMTVLHEMVHIYFWEQGYPNHGHDKYFRWVIGHIGASMTNTSTYSGKWQRCIQPFLNED